MIQVSMNSRVELQREREREKVQFGAPLNVAMDYVWCSCGRGAFALGAGCRTEASPDGNTPFKRPTRRTLAEATRAQTRPEKAAAAVWIHSNETK